MEKIDVKALIAEMKEDLKTNPGRYTMPEEWKQDFEIIYEKVSAARYPWKKLFQAIKR